MNNKGQTLVVFIILLPVLFLFLGLVYDFGLISLENKKIKNNIEEIISYSLDNLEEENLTLKIKENLENNLGSIKTNITLENNIVLINVKKEIKTIFIKKQINNQINITYKGYLDNNKKIITRIEG